MAKFSLRMAFFRAKYEALALSYAKVLLGIKLLTCASIWPPCRIIILIAAEFTVSIMKE